jgi:hypothetical protein
MITLGRILAGRGRAREAERLLQDALALRTERLGDGHPDVKRAADELAAVRGRAKS